jgi:hypothetical protein
LVLVLGLAGTAFAKDVIEHAVIDDIGKIDINGGGVHPKHYCDIWSDWWHLGGSVSVWTGANWYDSSCVFKKLIDPYAMLSETPSNHDCVDPTGQGLFPFSVESMHIILHNFLDAGVPISDTLRYIYYYDIELPGEFVPGCPADTVDPIPPGCYFPGPVIWESPLLYSGLGYGAWWLSYTFPNVPVDGPFFISFHIYGIYDVDWNKVGDFGLCSDAYFTGYLPAVPCWNFDQCLYIPQPYDWFEWYCYGWDFIGNMLFWCDGRPMWNVAVDLGSFEAVPGEGMVTVNWQSLAEHNNDHWIVERNGEQIWQEQGQGDKETPTEYTFVDRNVTPGTEYSYTLKAVGLEGNVDEYGPVMATPFAALPTQFALMQNYPNPFNASTVIRYQLASKEHVTLKVYNIYGQEVASLVEADQKAGSYTVSWAGQGISSGMYLYTLTAGDYSESKKMILLK